MLLHFGSKAYSLATTFLITPYAAPNVDAEITTEVERYELQVTISDPIWQLANGETCNGGYDHRLRMEALNKHGVVHGLAAMRREGDNFVSLKPVKSTSEEFDAYRRGVERALRTKLEKKARGLRLLVHARGYEIGLINFSLKAVVEAAIDAVGRAAVDGGFGAYYFVTGRAEDCFEYVPDPSSVKAA